MPCFQQVGERLVGAAANTFAQWPVVEIVPPGNKRVSPSLKGERSFPMTKPSITVAVTALALLSLPAMSLAQSSGGGGTGGSAAGASAGGAAGGGSAGSSSPAGSPPAGGAGAGSAAVSGVPSGPANV